MNNLDTLAARRGKIRALCIALSLAVGILAESAAALAVDPQNNVRGFYDTLLTTMKDGRITRAERALWEARSGC